VVVTGSTVRPAVAASGHAGPCEVESQLIEVCACMDSCACWHLIPRATPWCESVLAWCIDGGTINGVEVSDRAIAAVVRRRRQRDDGDWTTAVFIDERCTEEQAALLAMLFSSSLSSVLAARGPAHRAGAAHQRLHVPDNRASGPSLRQR
jgi:hypothetical protein